MIYQCLYTPSGLLAANQLAGGSYIDAKSGSQERLIDARTYTPAGRSDPMSDKDALLNELGAAEARLTRHLMRQDEKLNEIVRRLDQQDAVIDSIAATLLSPSEIALLNGMPVTSVRAKAR
jgi:hypothetical protein